MSNTRVMSCDFEGCRPDTLEEALRELAEEGSKPLAGGTDLLNSIKINLLQPRRLVWVLGIRELASIRADGAALRIGAGARLSEVEMHRDVLARFPALAEAINVIGGVQIRNMATLAGNLCNASPGADTPPILLALDAQVELVALARSGMPGIPGMPSMQRRILPLGGFFTGPKRTVLRPGELLTEIRLPAPPRRSGAAFRRLARVSLDIAKINCAAFIARDGNTIADVRVALGSVAPTPVRAPAVEALLKGAQGGTELFQEAAARVGEDIAPIDDVRSTAEYRREIASVLVREALEQAWERAERGGPARRSREDRP
jgi:carbon-monoxide dehydrogenase medium subunit